MWGQGPFPGPGAAVGPGQSSCSCGSTGHGLDSGCSFLEVEVRDRGAARSGSGEEPSLARRGHLRATSSHGGEFGTVSSHEGTSPEVRTARPLLPFVTPPPLPCLVCPQIQPHWNQDLVGEFGGARCSPAQTATTPGPADRVTGLRVLAGRLPERTPPAVASLAVAPGPALPGSVSRKALASFLHSWAIRASARRGPVPGLGLWGHGDSMLLLQVGPVRRGSPAQHEDYFSGQREIQTIVIRHRGFFSIETGTTWP